MEIVKFRIFHGDEDVKNILDLRKIIAWNQYEKKKNAVTCKIKHLNT